MTLLVTLIIGFSVIACALLYATYVFFLHNLNKSPRALTTSFLLLFGLSMLQLGHLGYLWDGLDPLSSWSYRFWLFLVPSMFYLFSRSILFEETRFTPSMLVHITPVLLIFVPQQTVAISLLFCIGTGYSIWLTQVIYSLRESRGRSKFELFFLVLFSVMAVGVLILGFSLPYMDVGYFYVPYALGIGLALVLVVATLLGFPELLAELAEVARLRYESSTLTDLDVAATKQRLEQLMSVDKLYQNEHLTLATAAEALDVTTHQLSELINTEYGVSFSRFVREHRIQAAQTLLKDEPKASILSISMEVGFKSQSNFYAAFKEITGESPGTYRKSTTV